MSEGSARFFGVNRDGTKRRGRGGGGGGAFRGARGGTARIAPPKNYSSLHKGQNYKTFDLKHPHC